MILLDELKQEIPELEHSLQEADAALLMKRFSREDYLCNPPPDRVSRCTGNGRYPSATALTLGECSRGCEKLRTSLNKSTRVLPVMSIRARTVSSTMVTLAPVSPSHFSSGHPRSADIRPVPILSAPI